MPQLLELGHLFDQHAVAQVQVRGGRVEAGLHPQRPPGLQARQQEVRGVAGDRALEEQIEGIQWRNVAHTSILA